MANDTTYNVFQRYGTNAARLAFTPAPAAGTQPIYLWYETDTGSLYLYYTSWILIAGSGATFYVDPYGALDGDGSIGSPLAVRVDNTTIIINGSNELQAVSSGLVIDPYGALYGDGTIYY